MTEASRAPRLEFEDLAGAIDALRTCGLRLTTPRRLVLEALFAADGPAPAERIATGAQLDLTSVYRNLEHSSSMGLCATFTSVTGPGSMRSSVEVSTSSSPASVAVPCVAVSPEQLDPVRDQIGELFGYRPASPTSPSSASVRTALG